MRSAAGGRHQAVESDSSVSARDAALADAIAEEDPMGDVELARGYEELKQKKRTSRNEY